jgi:tetratricopeptide (TPR) repeat protein
MQHNLRKDYDKAIVDLTTAIDVSGEHHLCYLNRACVFKTKGDRDAAKRDLDRMAERVPNKAPALNNLAWILGTHRDKWVRDGAYAVKIARRACELTEWKDPTLLDTLAAAYAESGLFDEAVEYQDKALSLADEKAAEAYRRRLKLYRSGKPYRASGN